LTKTAEAAAVTVTAAIGFPASRIRIRTIGVMVADLGAVETYTKNASIRTITNGTNMMDVAGPKVVASISIGKMDKRVKNARTTLMATGTAILADAGNGLTRMEAAAVTVTAATGFPVSRVRTRTVGVMVADLGAVETYTKNVSIRARTNGTNTMVAAGLKVVANISIGKMDERMKNARTTLTAIGTGIKADAGNGLTKTAEAAAAVTVTAAIGFPASRVRTRTIGVIVADLGAVETCTKNVLTRARTNGTNTMVAAGLKVVANISIGKMDEKTKNVWITKTKDGTAIKTVAGNGLTKPVLMPMSIPVFLPTLGCFKGSWQRDPNLS